MNTMPSTASPAATPATDAFYLLQLSQHGSGGEFIVPHADAQKVIGWMQRGVPFMCWVNRAGAEPRTSGMVITPMSGGLSITMTPLMHVPVDPHGRPIPRGAQTAPASYASPAQWAAQVWAVDWSEPKKDA